MLLQLSNRFLKQATFYLKFASYVINLDDMNCFGKRRNKILSSNNYQRYIAPAL